jgi:hypothetical protein
MKTPFISLSLIALLVAMTGIITTGCQESTPSAATGSTQAATEASEQEEAADSQPATTQPSATTQPAEKKQSASAPAKKAANEVVWPLHKKVDTQLHEAMALLEDGKADRVAGMGAQLGNAITQLSKSSPPANAKQKELVTQLLKDLAGVAPMFDGMEDRIEEERIVESVEAAHTLIVKIGEAAGIPHKHDDHDHDHHDHDHSDHNH